MIYEHENGDNVFFTSDNHFGHENIIKYCDRPFDSVEEMDRAMVDRWNEVVPGDGIVYHLGDFTLNDEAYLYWSELRGIKRLLTMHWHHDKRWLPGFMDRASILPVFFIGQEAVIRIGDQFIHLSHYPVEDWDRMHYGAWQLHGHSHGSSRRVAGRMDVGVDCWDFYPVSYEQVKEKMEND